MRRAAASMRRRLLLRSVLAAACAAAGCAGDGPATNSANDQFTVLQRTIFDETCLASGCHNGITRPGGLVLEAGVSWGNLVDQPAENGAAQESGWKRVVPFEAADSFLLRKLTQVGEGEGSMMPLGSAALSAADIDLVAAWIEAGAPAPETAGATPSPTPLNPRLD